MMRILTAQLKYEYDDEALKARRDRLGKHGFDVTAIDDEILKHGCALGMTDAQFIDLTIEGEKDMIVVASVVVETAEEGR